MGGAFRDDEVAARQRADVLDERVRELEAEKLALEARLSGGPPSGSTPQRRGLSALREGRRRGQPARRLTGSLARRAQGE